jgi:hypothetical protein
MVFPTNQSLYPNQETSSVDSRLAFLVYGLQGVDKFECLQQSCFNLFLFFASVDFLVYCSASLSHLAVFIKQVSIEYMITTCLGLLDDVDFAICDFYILHRAKVA